MITDSLLSRLQVLTGPDREIDAEIALANGWHRHHSSPYWRKGADKNNYSQELDEPPRYTEIVNDAMALLPEKWTWNLGKWISNSGDGLPVYWADLHGREEAQGRHPIAAIALLIAIYQMKEEIKS